ncbi:hypothetical protein LCGC14_0330020 [marine sediment metagenome]|uniref:TGS domain-containing protein n=1 Tax=marine sediment metagenome TaxID=412755 RepID=A0A0F9TMD3_9ZZZZ
MYDEDVLDGMINVRIGRGGEVVDTQVPENSTVQALIEDGHLRGIKACTTRVNGSPATPNTPLQNGDQVSQIPRSGKQG